MLAMKHPVTGALYTAEDGKVRVEHKGQCGYFGPDGAYLHGELRHADPLMCVWIAPGHTKASPAIESLKLLSLGGNIATEKKETQS
jgi:hypothetical protein